MLEVPRWRFGARIKVSKIAFKVFRNTWVLHQHLDAVQKLGRCGIR